VAANGCREERSKTRQHGPPPIIKIVVASIITKQNLPFIKKQKQKSPMSSNSVLFNLI